MPLDAMQRFSSYEGQSETRLCFWWYGILQSEMLQVRAKTFYAEKKGLNVADVDVPVIGGHAGVTILPLFSQASPHAQLSDEETDQLTKRTQDGGTEVVAAKAGKVQSAMSLSTGYLALGMVIVLTGVLMGFVDCFSVGCLAVHDPTTLVRCASQLKMLFGTSELSKANPCAQLLAGISHPVHGVCWCSVC